MKKYWISFELFQSSPPRLWKNNKKYRVLSFWKMSHRHQLMVEWPRTSFLVFHGSFHIFETVFLLLIFALWERSQVAVNNNEEKENQKWKLWWYKYDDYDEVFLCCDHEDQIGHWSLLFFYCPFDLCKPNKLKITIKWA